ncbi:MAG: hypothetical protein K8L99_13460 [Anaerolineae bacterium]|nr:hypothetical protein [Anaerolineae bacterium]
MDLYGQTVREAVKGLALEFAPIIESYAKENAPWTDRTANARQSLYTVVEELSQDVVALYLSHGVYYGIFLEVRYAGNYGIVWQAIEAHLPEITQRLHQLFDR